VLRWVLHDEESRMRAMESGQLQRQFYCFSRGITTVRSNCDLGKLNVPINDGGRRRHQPVEDLVVTIALPGPVIHPIRSRFILQCGFKGSVDGYDDIDVDKILAIHREKSPENHRYRYRFEGVILISGDCHHSTQSVITMSFNSR
jgi:hypothetical protein